MESEQAQKKEERQRPIRNAEECLGALTDAIEAMDPDLDVTVYLLRLIAEFVSYGTDMHTSRATRQRRWSGFVLLLSVVAWSAPCCEGVKVEDLTVVNAPTRATLMKRPAVKATNGVHFVTAGEAAGEPMTRGVHSIRWRVDALSYRTLFGVSRVGNSQAFCEFSSSYTTGTGGFGNGPEGCVDGCGLFMCHGPTDDNGRAYPRAHRPFPAFRVSDTIELR